MKNTHSTFAFTLLISLGLIWGTGYTIARYAMTHGIHPLGYSLWLALGPAILLNLYRLARKQPLPLNIPHLRYYTICGFTGIALPNTLMYIAAAHMPAGLMAIVVNTAPLFAYPMALLAGVEAFHVWRLFAVSLAASGLFLLLWPEAQLPQTALLPWLLLSLLTPLCFAFCSVYISRFRPHDTHALPLASGTLWVASMLLTPLAWSTQHLYALHWPLAGVDVWLLIEVILSSLGYLLFFVLIRIAGPVYYSFVDGIVAITGLFWGLLIFHEKLDYWTGPAVLLILLSLFLITHLPKRV